MKQTTILVCSLVLLMATAFKSDNNCESFFPNEVGTKWELTNYDAKDKVTSKSLSQLTGIKNVADGMEATINIEIFDDKNKSLNKGDVIMKCTQDKFLMDMSNMFPKDQFNGMNDVSIEISDQYMEFPSNPVAGQTLPDDESTMTVSMNGMTIMSMKMKTTNRKVEGTETITTPAGTYNCVKYSSDTEVSSTMFKSKSKSTMYMAKNVGMVKMESYDDKGKLQTKQLLTSFGK